MIRPCTHNIAQRLSVLLWLNVTLVSSVAYPATAAPLLLSQAADTTLALDCDTEQQQAADTQFTRLFSRAEQAIAQGQVDYASQLLVQALQDIRELPNSAVKVDLLERLVGSLGPNVAYTSPLDQLVQAVPPQAPRVALVVLDEAFETTQTLSSSYSASKVRTLTTLANDFTRLEQRDRSRDLLSNALTTVRTIQGADFQTIALSDIAEAYIKVGDQATAAPLLDRVLPIAQSIDDPNPYVQANALERITSLYAQIGQLEPALEAVRLIQLADYSSPTVLTIVDRYSEMGQIDRAIAVLEHVQQPDQKAIAIATIAGRLTAQQPEQAEQYYAEAIALAKLTQNPNGVMAQLTLRYIETGGLVAIGEDTIQSIADPAVQVPALGAIALSYAKAGQEDLSQTFLTQAIELLATLPNESDRTTIRQQLMDQAIQQGRYDYALTIAQTIQSEETTSFQRVDALAYLATQAIAADRYDAALEVTRQIPPSFVDGRSQLLQIARGLAEAGEFDRAQAIAQEESVDPGFQAKVAAVVAAQVLLVAGQIDPATALFDQAAQLASEISDSQTRAETYAAIAVERLRANQPDDATRLLNQAITTAQSVEDPSSRSFLLRTLAEQLIFANQYQAAIQVAEAIPEPSDRIAKLNEAIEKAVAAGDSATVLAALERLDNPVAETRWLVALVDLAIQSGDQSQATTLLAQALQTAQTIPGDESQTIAVRGGEDPLIVDDDQDRGSFLSAIALKYAQIGQISQADQIAQTLEDTAAQQRLTQQINCYR